jgi:hypothetical protein
MTIVHIMAGFGTYTENFIQFTRENFDTDEHEFILTKNKAGIKGKRILDLSEDGYLSRKNKIDRKLKKADRIILHGIYDDFWLWYFNFRRGLLEKTFWFIWGGDLYYYKFRPKIIRSQINEFLRKRMFSKLNRIITFNTGNYGIYKKIYNENARLSKAFYPFRYSYDDLDRLMERKREDGPLRIIAGNSASENNLHNEILDALSGLKDEPLEIFMPLSYGVIEDYVNSVIEKGKELFGDRFKPLTEHMDEMEYYTLLSRMDVGFYYQDRPQGMGNILPLVYMGKKVFIKSNMVTWELFKDLGIEVFDSHDAKRMDIAQFSSISERSAEKNGAIIREAFSKEMCIRNWSDIFSERL